MELMNLGFHIKNKKLNKKYKHSYYNILESRDYERNFSNISQMCCK
jgi:hypothetical protein